MSKRYVDLIQKIIKEDVESAPNFDNFKKTLSGIFDETVKNVTTVINTLKENGVIIELKDIVLFTNEKTLKTELVFSILEGTIIEPMYATLNSALEKELNKKVEINSDSKELSVIFQTSDSISGY